MEEKGSDVNLAAHLLNGAWKGMFDAAAVISNDTGPLGDGQTGQAGVHRTSGAFTSENLDQVAARAARPGRAGPAVARERSPTARVEGEYLVNRDKFKEETEKLSGGHRIDATKMEKWFEGTLGMLDSLGKQKDSIRHPGHRGSLREKPLLDLLEEMLPSGLVPVKGIALTALMAESKEQDILIVDRNAAGAILPGRSRHFPIESCLASIQVKSRLTRATIRHAAVNCMSLKSLGMFDDEAPWNSKNHGVCFGVFAYRSNYELAKLVEVVNEELETVERDLWPNLFYVVGEGMLIPADDQARISMDNETMFTGSKFCTVGDMGLVPTAARSPAYPFLWFLTNIIDHCIAQRKVRESPVYKKYWLQLFQVHARIREKERKKPEEGQ